MVTLTTIEMYSEKAQEVVTWNITLEKEEDEGGNEHEFIALRYGDELKKFSPSYTDEELLRVTKREDTERNN